MRARVGIRDGLTFAGAQLYGDLVPCGPGAPSLEEPAPPLHSSRADRLSSNEQLLCTKLQEQSNAVALHEATFVDVAAGRMSKPIPAADADLGAIRLVPRFGVEQERSDGTIKLRPVDDFSGPEHDSRPLHPQLKKCGEP